MFDTKAAVGTGDDRLATLKDVQKLRESDVHDMH
jgi:hypothetical protein